VAPQAGVTRRTFLIAGAAAGGGLVVGGYLAGAGGLLGTPVTASATFSPNIWVTIGTDDTVTIVLTQVEMGQGVMTSMPMLLAEELDADWQTIRTEWAPADERYGNPNFRGQQLTAGSNSVRGMWRILRESGAAARGMLMAAAAEAWDVPVGEVTTAQGEVVHAASDRRQRYGALVARAATLPVPEQVTLKDPGAFALLGQSVPRLDIPSKVDGSAQFGIDVTRPGMLVARVVRCPVFGGRVARFDPDRAMAVPGVRHVVPISAGLAVVADHYHAASQGVQALDVTWDEGPLANLDSAAIRQQYAELAGRPGAVARDDGDAPAALAGTARAFERVYEAPFLAHACMEPMNCTADVRDDGCDVWVPTQGQTVSHQAAVAASGLPPDRVHIHTTLLGGGFGRRGESDFVTDAVETSRAVRAPVKVIWSREDDIQHDFYRPVSYVRMWGAVDGRRQPVAFMQRLVQQSLMSRSGRLPPNGVDFISVEGASNLPYDIPNVRVEYVETDPGIPYGFWRSVGASVNGFVVEAFIDELAAAAGEDPFEFRRQRLTRHPRHKAVLELAAERAGWGTPLPAGRGRGIAIMECFGSIVAEVAEVSVADGAVRVHKVWCAVDTGWVVHPDTIRAQMEGGTIYGLSAALSNEITIARGRVVQRHFGDYPVMRIGEAPEVETFIVPSAEAPGGIGEPSTAVAAGALVNAIAAVTRRRIYRLPVRADDLRPA
jgi:isoquinoline 1-oxidoreductase subunit beta